MERCCIKHNTFPLRPLEREGGDVLGSGVENSMGEAACGMNEYIMILLYISSVQLEFENARLRL